MERSGSERLGDGRGRENLRVAWGGDDSLFFGRDGF